MQGALVAGGNAIRGTRVGAGPMGEAERGEAAPRTGSLLVRNRHETRVAFASDADVPELWDCPRCGLPAGQDQQNPPPAPRTEPYKTHLAYVRERRSDADGDALLEEALTRLHRAAAPDSAAAPGRGPAAPAASGSSASRWTAHGQAAGVRAAGPCGRGRRTRPARCTRRDAAIRVARAVPAARRSSTARRPAAVHPGAGLAAGAAARAAGPWPPRRRAARPPRPR